MLSTYRMVGLVHRLHPKRKLIADAFFSTTTLNYYLMLRPLGMFHILKEALYIIQMAIEILHVMSDSKDVFEPHIGRITECGQKCSVLLLRCS